MDSPKQVIESLSKFGMTEMEIAAELKADGVAVSQATINRLKTGVHHRTSFEVGMALVRLHARRFAKATAEISASTPA